MIEINYYLAVGVGCLVYLLLQLNGVLNLPKFTWKEFIKTNIVATIINLIIGFFLVLARKEIVNLYPITLLSSFLLGVSGQAILKKITVMFDSKIDTVIGIKE